MANLRANTVCGAGGRNALDGSVFFNGDDYLSLAANTDFAMGTGAFTVECWIYTTDYSHAEGGYSQRVFDSNGGQLGWYITSDGTGLTGSLVSGTDERSTYAPGLQVWSHIALARSGTTLKAFLNGVEVDSTTNAGSVASSGAFIVGAKSATEGAFKGYISNLRVIKGTALYTAAFTPPTEKLTVIDGTVLLCCQDSDDPTQEATGKTITGYGKLAAGQEYRVKQVPPVGIDAGVTFDGEIKINTPNVMYFPTGHTSERGRGRGLIACASCPSDSNVVEYVEIQSQGTAKDFGDLSIAISGSNGGCSSSTRGLFAGGWVNPANSNVIEYFTISTTSNSTDFGDMTVIRRGLSGCGNDTRGLFVGGRADPGANPTDVIDYVTIATIGNAIDFGNLSLARRYLAATSNTTRGLSAGGYDSSPGDQSDVIDYVTIATTGNATDFGNLTTARDQLEGNASSTRGVFGGGANSPTFYNIIDYVTIASTGNATDFGDLINAKADSQSASNSLRGLWAGGQTPTKINTISYVDIATTGNAKDFGDLSVTATEGSGCSDSHGGIE